MFFRNKDYGVTEELKEHLSYQQNELLVIDDIRRNHGDIELEVKWRGFTDEETDWVALSTLPEDVPVLFKDVFADVKENGSARQRTMVSSI